MVRVYSPQPGREPGSGLRESDRRILLVEDNADYIMLITDALETRGEGYKVFGVDSPEKALEILDREEFDLVLLDYKFPKGNGLEMIRKLKNKETFIPAVMITAFGSEEVAIEAMREGALDFLPKTRDFLQALPNVVRRVLERSRIIQERIRTHEALERRNRELSILNRLATLLSQSLQLDRVLEESLAQVLNLMALETGWVLLKDDEGGPDRLVASAGVPEGFDGGLAWDVAADLLHEALSTGKACLRPGPSVSGGGGETASHFLIPLQATGQVLGVIWLVGPVDRHYPYSEMELLTGIGRQVGVATEKARLYQELDRTKAYLEDLVDNAGDKIITLDRSGRILSWNSGAEAITGYSEEEMVGREWGILIPDDRKEEMRDLMAQVLRGKTISNFETMRLHKNGNRIDVAVTFSPIRDQQGDIVGISSVARDITRRKRFQEQLMQVEKMAATGQLISGVAHELNNPLTAVIGYSQLITTAQTGEKLESYLEKITTEAMRCQRIVQNLLTFAREHRPETRPLDINDVVRATIELRRYEMRIKDIQVDLQLDRGLPFIQADFHELQQVFMNLITNAEHAMESGGPGTLTVRSEVLEGPEPSVRVAFEDTGPGIPDSQRSRIFEPFFTTKEVGQGTGLGLSLSYGIVRSHGGAIYAENRSGGGARFVVEIPCRPVAEAEDAAAEEAAPEALPAPGPKRILVVDDEPTIRDMFHEVLSMTGHRIDLAENGRSALEKIRSEDYDLVITDLKMPEFDGEDLYMTLREQRPDMVGRLMFSTGDVISSNTRSFLERAGNAVISKPCGAREIHEKVNAFFNEAPPR